MVKNTHRIEIPRKDLSEMSLTASPNKFTDNPVDDFYEMKTEMK